MANIRIYTTSYCGYCVAAKRLLTKKGLTFEEIDVTHSPRLREWLVQVTGTLTVPQVFLFDTPVGGYRELAALERSGRLDPSVLADAGSDDPTSPTPEAT